MTDMSNTWNTPAYPRAPYPTPASNLKKPTLVYHSKSVRRAPIENPFDKFPQEDFDAWIGNITGTLRRALGEEDATNEDPRPIHAPSDSHASVSSRKLGENDYSEAESFVDDSFAELKARRSVNKGKARDPREGPGLGPKYGGQDQPIEIISGSEEEEVEQEELLGEGEEGSEGEDGSEYGSGYDRDEEDLAAFEAGYSEDARHSEWRQKHGYVGQEENTQEEHGSDIERRKDADEDEGDQEEAEEVIELLTDSEAESIRAHSREGEEEEEEEEEYLSDEELIRSSPAEGEDQYETAGLEEDEDEIQPLDNDTYSAFPPLANRDTGSKRSAVDLPDPWADVEKYAEDYYAGGTVKPDGHGRIDAHHLGVNDDDDDDERFLSPDVVTPDEEEISQSGDEKGDSREHRQHEDYENEESTPQARDKSLDRDYSTEPTAGDMYSRHVYGAHFQPISELRSTGEVTSFERHLPPHFASQVGTTHEHLTQEIPKLSPEIIAIDSDDDWDNQEDELADTTDYSAQVALQVESEQRTAISGERALRTVGGDGIDVIGPKIRSHESPAVFDFTGLPKEKDHRYSTEPNIPSPLPASPKLLIEALGEKEDGLPPFRLSPTPSIPHIGAVETGDDITGLYDNIESERKGQHDVVEHLFDLNFPSTLTHGIATSSDYLRTFGIDSGSIFESPSDARHRRQAVDMEDMVDEDEPGAFPLMTSDLDYERPTEDEMADYDVVDAVPEPGLESTPKPSATPEGYVLPAEVVEADDDGDDIRIVVEGAEGQPSFSGDTHDILIAVIPATPAHSSRSSTPGVETSQYLKESRPDGTLGRAVWPPFPEPMSVGANSPASIFSGLEATGVLPEMESTSLLEQEVPKIGNNLSHAVAPLDKLTENGPITELQQSDSREESFGNAEGNAVHEEGEIEQVSSVDGSRDGSREEQRVSNVDKLPYVISEPSSDKLSPEAEGPDRPSLEIANVHPDEVIAEVIPTADIAQVASGFEHVEDISGRISPCSGGQNEPPSLHPTDSHLSTPEVGESEVSPRLSADVVDDTNESTTSMPNDYFAQPGSPVWSDLAMGLGTPSLPMTPNGGRPTIINLPGTPLRVLSPGGTPQPGPTPVSIVVDPSFLKALRTDPNLFKATLNAPSISSDVPVPDPPRTPPSEVAESVRPSSYSLPITGRSPTLESTRTFYPNLGAQSSVPGALSSSPITVTRKSTDPVLVPDPYPYSLSTPIPPSFVQEALEEGSEDDSEQDNSASLTPTNEGDTDSKGSSRRTSDKVAGDIVQLNGENSSEASASGIKEEENTASVADLMSSHSNAQEDTEGRHSSESMDSESREALGKASHSSTEEHEHRHSLPEVPEVVVPTLESVIEALSSKHPESDSEHSSNDEHPNLPSPHVHVPRVRIEPKSEDVLGHVLSRSTHNWPYPTTKSPQHKKNAESPRLEHAKASVYSLEQSDSVKKDTLQHVLSRSSHPQRRSQSTTPRRKTASPAPVLPDLGQVKAPVYSLTYAATHAEANVSVEKTVHHIPSPLRATTFRHKSASPELPRFEQASAPVYSLSESTSDMQARPPSPADSKLPTGGLEADLDPQPTAATAGKRKRSLSDVSDKPASSSSMPASASAKEAVVQGAKKRARRPKKEPSKQIHAIRAMDFGTTQSRSPSVASTAVSDNASFIAQPSPTTNKPHMSTSEPQPFLHAHSRRKKAREPVTVQEQVQKHGHKMPLLSRSHDGSLKAEVVLANAQHALSQRDTSSPVTRSHCRYHKISIPKTDNGPRIFFLVPGCTLNDEELISEEEIEDHGIAMIHPDTRIVGDIETLDLDPYLLWVIRQLVGLDITRENEVFYLPQPDEEIVRQSSKPTKTKSKTRKSTSNLTDPAGNSVFNRTQPNLSRESSVTSSASVLQRMLVDSDIESLSTVTDTEDEAVRSPDRQRPRRKGEVIQDKVLGEESTLVEKSEAKSPQNGSRKRMRRLGKDAAAYKPSTDSLTDESGDGASRRKPSQDRKLKRARASEANSVEVDNRRVKKLKTHPNKSEEISNSS